MIIDAETMSKAMKVIKAMKSSSLTSMRVIGEAAEAGLRAVAEMTEAEREALIAEVDRLIDGDLA